MTEKTDLPNISMANTKKELLEAYEEAKERFESLSKDLLDAEKARKRLEKKMAAATADAQAAQDPLKRLQDLRGTISRELTDLAERFETEIETYRKIQSAIETKNEELNTIYEVETAASDLAALIDAQRVKKEQFEREMQDQKSAFEVEMEDQKSTFEVEMEEIRTQWQREKADRDRRVKEQAEALDKQRQREKEEYEYTFARDKAQRKNALDDELQTLRKRSSPQSETNSKTNLKTERPSLTPGKKLLQAAKRIWRPCKRRSKAFPNATKPPFRRRWPMPRRDLQGILRLTKRSWKPDSRAKETFLWEKSRRLRRWSRHRRPKSAIWPKRMNWPTKRFRISPTVPSPLPGEIRIRPPSNNPTFRCVTTAKPDNELPLSVPARSSTRLWTLRSALGYYAY